MDGREDNLAPPLRFHRCSIRRGLQRDWRQANGVVIGSNNPTRKPDRSCRCAVAKVWSRALGKGGRHEETHDPQESRGQVDAAARTGRLFSHRRPAAAQAARRSASRILDHRQSRSLGHRQADGAPGAGPAHRPDAAARRAELELARIRHAGRRVALLRAVQAAQHSADARDQCARLRGLYARRRTGPHRPLGVHGACLRARTHSPRAEPEKDDHARARRDRALLPASARSAGSVRG